MRIINATDLRSANQILNFSDAFFTSSSYLTVDGKNIYLSFIVVKRKFRRKGVTTNLINRIRYFGYTPIVDSPNWKMKRLCEKLKVFYV